MSSRLFSSISTYRNRISQASSLQTQASSSIPAAYRNRMLSSSLKLKPYLTSNLKLNPQLKTMHDQQNIDSPQSQLVETRSLKLKPQTSSLELHPQANSELHEILMGFSKRPCENFNQNHINTITQNKATKNMPKILLKQNSYSKQLKI
jgi:hypothetical protein